MNLRNLEQIQEQDPRSRPLPIGALFLSAIAGGALVVALVTTFQRDAEPAVQKRDPLAELLAQQKPVPPAAVVDDAHVTFPEILSDKSRPTTALAAVKDERGRLVDSSQQQPQAEEPSSLTGRIELPETQLPAGDLLQATSVTTEPKDDLSQLAASRLAGNSAEMAPPGEQGGYEIQVASFSKLDDAEAFVVELRKRGHRAYRQAAYVADRGLWHRVRIGSFPSKYEALRYQKKLEETERVSTFLVDPDKIRRQKEIRDAKERARERKLKRQQERKARLEQRAK